MQQKVDEFVKKLQKDICHGLESLENNAKFEFYSWNRLEDASGGGGIMGKLSGGVIFEKAGVNVSTVYGEFEPEFAKQIPGAEENPSFWASGLSLVIHPRNPYVPIVHMNVRYIQTTKTWFGGGIDLTPAIINKTEAKKFHDCLKKVCDRHNINYYEKYKKWADEYFYLPHRNEPRGIGGIFYDYLNSGSEENDFSFMQDVGNNFLNAYLPIIQANYSKSWGVQEEEALKLKRSRYVEFNLLYDRGTIFGLKTKGYVPAILMSLPPRTGWD